MEQFIAFDVLKSMSYIKHPSDGCRKHVTAFSFYLFTLFGYLGYLDTLDTSDTWRPLDTF